MRQVTMLDRAARLLAIVMLEATCLGASGAASLAHSEPLASLDLAAPARYNGRASEMHHRSAIRRASAYERQGRRSFRKTKPRRGDTAEIGGVLAAGVIVAVAASHDLDRAAPPAPPKTEKPSKGHGSNPGPVPNTEPPTTPPTAPSATTGPAGAA